MKGKALRRALATSDAVRINSDLPPISDTTELITPDDAMAMLERNHHNRDVNWKAVEQYAEIMRRGEWKLTPQGIVLDGEGNILTGQKRLWAIVYANTSIYMRVSRGSPPDTAFVMDRGKPQSARDLSTRVTERKHSPTEASIARCVSILRGITKPSTDDIFKVIVEKDIQLKMIMKETAGSKKTKAVLMILGAIVQQVESVEDARRLVFLSTPMAEKLEHNLLPYSAEACWGRGASFGMAIRKALEIVKASASSG